MGGLSERFHFRRFLSSEQFRCKATGVKHSSTWNQNADVENLLRTVQNGLIGRVPILLLSRPVGFGRHHARY